MGKSLNLQLLVPISKGPIHKVIFPNILSFLPVPDFPNMIYPTQIVTCRLRKLSFQDSDKTKNTIQHTKLVILALKMN